jgi:hypothetical protein
MTKKTLLAGLLAVSVLLSACSLKATPDPNVQIQIAVNATLAAMPSAAPAPTNPVILTPTPFSLTGLFCEYQFCIGHPNYVSFMDKKAIDNPQLPSSYENGELTAYNMNPILLIYLIWLYAPDTSDSQFLLDTIISDNLDTQTGNLDVQLVGNLNVLYTPIISTISPDLSFGGAASWVCGDRVFAWKVYSPQAESFEALLAEALGKFRCE